MIWGADVCNVDAGVRDDPQTSWIATQLVCGPHLRYCLYLTYNPSGFRSRTCQHLYGENVARECSALACRGHDEAGYTGRVHGRTDV